MATWLQALPGRSVAIASSGSAFEGRILKPSEAVRYDAADPRLAAIAADITARGASVVGAQLVVSAFDPTPGARWPKLGELPS